MVTDLDVWAAECSNCGIVEYGVNCPQCGGNLQKLVVTIEEVLKTMESNASNLKKLLEMSIPQINTERDCSCHHSLTGAIL